MSKFTPGPWSLKYAERIVPADDIHGEKSICHVYATNQDENRRLIAAAPEMYELIQDFLSGRKYIRETHGDLPGVGWDRCQDKAIELLKEIDG